MIAGFQPLGMGYNLSSLGQHGNQGRKTRQNSLMSKAASSAFEPVTRRQSKSGLASID